MGDITMNFPNEKLLQPKEIQIPLKAVRKAIRNLDLSFWKSYGYVTKEVIESLCDDLKELIP